MYQHTVSATGADEIIRQFKTYETWSKLDVEFFTNLVKSVCANIDKLDEVLDKVTDRDIKKIDPVELSLLRLGAYELLYQFEVPYKVILNEYINLAKTFGSVKSHAYVNATLDKVAKTVREQEINC